MTRYSLSLLLLLGLAAASCNKASGSVDENRARQLSATPLPPQPMAPVGPIPGPKIARQQVHNPYGQSDAVAVNAGYKLFAQYNCAGCHGDHAGGGMGPSLRDGDWLYGSDDAHIFDSIIEGRAHGMPSWSVRIPEEQVWKIVSYIQSLRTAEEPDPPSPPPAPPNLPDIPSASQQQQEAPRDLPH